MRKLFAFLMMIGAGLAASPKKGGAAFSGPQSDDVDILARTIWGEARGEGEQGMAAVAAVIMNRVKDPRWPNTVRGVTQQPWQFSVWNAGDPNNQKARMVTASDADFKAALEIAELALSGGLSDMTGGADHYHTAAVSPSWSSGVQPVAIIGNHQFYRIV